MIRAALLFAVLTGPASGQTEPVIEVFPRDPAAEPSLEQVPQTRATEVGNADGAVLRALDRTAGQATDIEIAVGASVLFGRIGIQLQECRYPLSNPAADAFARLMIVDLDGIELFSGWMVGSSPALSAMDHPRYDVWVLRCQTP